MKYQERKKEIISLLEKLKSKNELFYQLYELLNSTQQIEEELLVHIHKMIKDIHEGLKGTEKEEELEELKDITNKLERIKLKENKTQKREEEEAERLLDNL